LNNLGYPERRGCAVVGLDRSTYDDIKFHKPTDREIRHLLLTDAIADIHARSRGTYGRLRIRAALEIEQGLRDSNPRPQPCESVLGGFRHLGIPGKTQLRAHLRLLLLRAGTPCFPLVRARSAHENGVLVA